VFAATLDKQEQILFLILALDAWMGSLSVHENRNPKGAIKPVRLQGKVKVPLLGSKCASSRNETLITEGMMQNNSNTVVPTGLFTVLLNRISHTYPVFTG